MSNKQKFNYYKQICLVQFFYVRAIIMCDYTVTSFTLALVSPSR